MAKFVASGIACWPPNPATERGAATFLDTDGNRLVYTSGYSVVVRDVKNPTESQVYVGHKKQTTVAKFTPDGKLIASGDKQGVVHVFDSNTMEQKKELMVVGGAVLDLDFDSSGKRLAAVGDSRSNNARAVMWESGTAQGELSGSSKRALTISIRPEKPFNLAIGSEDFKVRLHKGPPWKFTHSCDKHKNFVLCTRYSPDGSLLATSSSDATINLLDGEGGQFKSTLGKHKGSVYQIAWSEDGTKLLSCSGDKTVALWDVAAEKQISSITLGKDVTDMQVGCAMAVGDTCISLSLSGDLNYLDFNSGKVSQKIQAHTSAPLHLSRDWVSDSKEVYCGTANGDVLAYMPDGTAARFEGAKDIKCNDGIQVHKGKLYSAGHDDLLRSAEVGDGSYSFKPSAASIGSTPVGISAAAGDPTLVALSTREKVMLARDGKIVDTKPVKGFEVTAIGISEDGSECCVGGTDQIARVFKISNDKLEPTDIKFDNLQGQVASVAYSPSGSYIAVGDNNKEITLWSRDTRECLIRNKWVFHSAKINTMCWSPDGKYLASGSIDCQIIVWNPEKKMSKTKIQNAHPLGVNSLCWADDETVVSSGGDGCIRRWSPKLPK